MTNEDVKPVEPLKIEESAVSSGGVASDATTVPTELKDKFESYVPADNEAIIDTVSSKVVETIGTEVGKPEEANNEQKGGPLTPFEQFLNDTNLTYRQFIMFVLLIVLFLVILGFSIYLLFSFLGTEPKDIDVTDEVSVTNEVKVDQSNLFDTLKNSISGFFDSKSEVSVPDLAKDPVSEVPSKTNEVKPVNVPSQLGKPVVSKFKVSGFKAARIIGLGEISEDRLSYFVRTYRKIRNLYNTDLFNYLSVIPDRKKGYDQFVIQLKGSFEELKIANEDIQQEIAQLKARSDSLTQQTTELENQFFGDLDELKSENLPDTLQAFQEISQKKTIVLSELKARESIAAKLGKAIPLVEAKIKAIELNQDPFVKGVKVVDFDNVDLDLVVQSRN